MRVRFQILLSFALSAHTAHASCPVELSGKYLDSLIGAQQSEVYAYTKDAKGNPQVLPFEIHRKTKDDQFEFPQNRSTFSSFDEIAVDISSTDKTKLVNKECVATKPLYRVNHRNFEFFLGRCPAVQLSASQTVEYNEAENVLKSDRYVYKFNPDNHMLFDQVAFRNGQAESPVASDSDLLIHADVRNFFTFDFTKKDILSKMKNNHATSIGAIASLGFFLKVLFFKIEMSLTTDVAFYRSAAHIPMVITLPYSGKKNLHRKSGVLYSWKLAGDPNQLSTSTNMKLFSPKSFEDFDAFTSLGLQNCRSDICKYFVSYDVNGKSFILNFSLSRALVERGFYPVLVSDVSAHQKDMNWPKDYKEMSGRPGLYFEVSNLDEGEHKWDFWLEMGEANFANEDRCPAPYTIHRL